MKLDHVALWTHRLETLREYYMSYFQGEAGSLYLNPEKQFQSYFIRFDNGLRLELMTMPTVPSRNNESIDAQHTGWIHIAFSVESREAVDRMANELRRDGYHILDGPRTTGDGYYEFTTLDPDNNRVEVCSGAAQVRNPEVGQITLETLDSRLAVCLLPPGESIPEWVSGAPFWSVTRTPEETSVVCSDESVPAGVKAERNWRLLRVKGVLEFSLTWILSRLIDPLKNEGIPVFVLSTYLTDYLLIRETDYRSAIALLGSDCQIEVFLEKQG